MSLRCEALKGKVGSLYSLTNELNGRLEVEQRERKVAEERLETARKTLNQLTGKGDFIELSKVNEMSCFSKELARDLELLKNIDKETQNELLREALLIQSSELKRQSQLTAKTDKITQSKQQVPKKKENGSIEKFVSFFGSCKKQLNSIT